MRRWDVFCKVVDNYGDIGTCWRLVQQLASEHAAEVRLWVDDLGSFSRLCRSISPHADIQHVGTVEIRHWGDHFPDVEAADVVIEAFACELPTAYIAAMSLRAIPPVWINLEYLSAEAWVEDCHLLASPQSTGSLTKYFFFPGFTSRTGGLLQERDLLATRSAFDSTAASEFWRGLGIPPASSNELRISLFCYENEALPALLQSWSEGPGVVRVMATPGHATEQIARWSGQPLASGMSIRHASLTVHALPFLEQPDFDRLLWACDMNFVRGEDSFVRAQWAQRPFVWQIYPQAAGVHLVKLDAFLDRYLEKYQAPEVVRQFWKAWNGSGDICLGWQNFAANRLSVQQHCKDWAGQLDLAANLANNLLLFAYQK